MTVGSFLYITIDANDAGRVADFWAAALGTGRDAEMDDERYVFLAGREDLPVLCIQRVPEPKSGKTRIHLDLSVDDLEAATQRIVELGDRGPATSTRSRTSDGGPWPTRKRPSSTSR